MGALEEISTYLQSTAGGGSLGTEGTTIFLDSFVESTGAAIFIFEYFGMPPVRSYGDNGAPFIGKPRIQVVCRSTLPVGPGPARTNTARGKARRVLAKLEKVTNTALSGTTYLAIECRQEPYLLGRDEAGRVQIACNYDAWRRASTST